MAPSDTDRLRWLIALGLLLALTVLSHGPAFHADFVRYDDTGYVQSNKHVASGLRFASVRWALTGYDQANWHPLTWISHMVDVELFGFDPRGHHGVNIALHVLNVVVLFLVLRSLTGDPLPSLMVAAVFALHPANVESVAWISQRKTLLCTLFGLLSIAAYARHVRGGGRLPYVASLGWLALSLMSKPMLVTFPFVLLLLDFWPLRRAAFRAGPDGDVRFSELMRGWWRLLPEKLPCFALCIPAILITLDAQRVAMSSLEHYPVVQRLGNVALSYVLYLGTFFAPYRLAVFYPLYPERLTLPLVLGCVALLGGLTIALCRLGLRHRHLLVGWLWFLGTLVPVIGLVQVGMQSMADRYVYVPFWGLAIAIAWSLRDVFATRVHARAARAAAAVGFAGVLACLGVLTHRQAEEWHDAIRLFQDAIADTEGNWLAHSVLAERYYAQSEFEASIEHSREAVQYNRDLGNVRSTYGLALYATGRADLALEQFELAAQQQPENPVGFMNLGWLHAERGQYERALVDLSTAAQKITPGTSPYNRKTIYANWANALAKTNQLAAAREKYALALDVEPNGLDLLRDAARVDLQLGDPARAIERLHQALEVDPKDADAAYLLASATELQGGESGVLFARAQALAPRRAVVTVELARTLARQGKLQEAHGLLERILALTPAADARDAQFVTSTVHAHLGEILLERGDVAGGVAELERALAIWPENYDANNRLAFLLATSTDPALHDPARAVVLAERASAERREYGSLSTLAVAYAAAGRVPAAVETARQGLELATRASDPYAIAALEHQLSVYARLPGTVSDPTRP